ncbi:MAG: sigma-70 family RNA polymerase sigma factor [Acidobacteria bacterium]|nr:sigma-70 family RNA polymerase sigma factor [Acidobacteriota bacterium]
MKEESKTDITLILQQVSEGDESAKEHLIAVVYDELKRQARIYLLGERKNHTLQPTALVHETYLRLVNQNKVEWKNRNHFFAIAARLMRRILIDYARSRSAEKRGGSNTRFSLDDKQISTTQRSSALIALDDALERLSAIDPRKARIVEMKFFGGLNESEIAEIEEVSTRTLRREWRIARLWLYRELRD